MKSKSFIAFPVHITIAEATKFWEDAGYKLIKDFKFKVKKNMPREMNSAVIVAKTQMILGKDSINFGFRKMSDETIK